MVKSTNKRNGVNKKVDKKGKRINKGNTINKAAEKKSKRASN